MRVAAVDLGATSARVAVVDDSGEVEIVHRYAHQPVRHADGSLRWDWARLMDEVERGLDKAGSVDSIGVDTWGVDYGLLDADGKLVASPFSYRDERTAGWRAVVDRIGEQRLYETTGIQLMPINTIFQLAAHQRDELDEAATLLMLPELAVYHLTGAITAETTSAGTSGLVSLATDTWDESIIDEIGVSPDLFAPIARAGTRVGEWRGIPVHLVGGHDTASAVYAHSLVAPDRAFVSTGTWILVGAVSDMPVVTPAARAANFSNERAVDGGYRILKNVTGLWLLEQCRARWGSPSIDELFTGAAGLGGPLVDPDDPRFARPTDMPAEIAAATGLAPDDRPRVTRCIIDSIAAKVADVVIQLEDVTDTRMEALEVFGGGIRNELLLHAIGSATDLTCSIGSSEATALGNARAQFASCTDTGGM